MVAEATLHRLEWGKVLLSINEDLTNLDMFYEGLKFPPFRLFPDDGRPCFLMNNLAKPTFTSRRLILQPSPTNVVPNYRVFQADSNNIWFAAYLEYPVCSNKYVDFFDPGPCQNHIPTEVAANYMLLIILLKQMVFPKKAMARPRVKS